MKQFLPTLLLALAACASSPWHPRPVVAPSMAVLCAPGRVVYCAEDTGARCALVQAALAEIDAVVPGLQVFGGEINWSNVGTWQRANVPVTVWAVIPRATANEVGIPANTLGATRPNPNNETMCEQFVTVGLFWSDGELSQDEAFQVVLHEMLHSLGMGHADTMAPWSTVMRPGLSSERRHGLSIVDRNWLRAVYGQ